MIRALLQRLLANHREHQAHHQLKMDIRRCDAIRRELAGLDELCAELNQAHAQAIEDLGESAQNLRNLINQSAPATHNEMRNA